MGRHFSNIFAVMTIICFVSFAAYAENKKNASKDMIAADLEEMLLEQRGMDGHAVRAPDPEIHDDTPAYVPTETHGQDLFDNAAVVQDKIGEGGNMAEIIENPDTEMIKPDVDIQTRIQDDDMRDMDVPHLAKRWWGTPY